MDTKEVQDSLWSSVFATSAMTVALFLIHDKLGKFEKSPLPPATISQESAERAQVADFLSPLARQNLTLVSHYAYGAVGALLYSILEKKLARKQNAALKGGLYGTIVWLFSYYLETPMLRFRANAYDMPESRNGMMLAAHLVWGSVLGIALDAMTKAGTEMLDGRGQALAAE